MVLVPAISGLGAGNDGRVGGLGTKTVSDVTGLFQDDYVLSTMTLDGAAFDGESGDNADGTSKTAEELADRATWEAQGFDMSEDGLWSWDAALSRAVLKGDAVGYDVYIMTQPRSTNAYTDKAAVFYTTAKGGIGTLTYTWQRSADGETWEAYQGRRKRNEALPAGQAPVGRQPDPLQGHGRNRHDGLLRRGPARPSRAATMTPRRQRKPCMRPTQPGWSRRRRPPSPSTA